ncbi:MAG: hypothetical protein M3173_04560, partial [Chloroflexota bacterium]|nr:hypothetical protein [Chloroflexota bacterium]
SYATVMEIPIAWFGLLLMYLSLIALAGLRLWKPGFLLYASAAALAITAAGTLYSGWLTWIELYVIDAICQWCVVSAIITTLLFVIEIAVFRRLWSGAEDDDREYPGELAEP